VRAIRVFPISILLTQLSTDLDLSHGKVESPCFECYKWKSYVGQWDFRRATLSITERAVIGSVWEEWPLVKRIITNGAPLHGGYHTPESFIEMMEESERDGRQYLKTVGGLP
jgi:hypothetical protein